MAPPSGLSHRCTNCNWQDNNRWPLGPRRALGLAGVPWTPWRGAGGCQLLLVQRAQRQPGWGKARVCVVCCPCCVFVHLLYAPRGRHVLAVS